MNNRQARSFENLNALIDEKAESVKRDKFDSFDNFDSSTPMSKSDNDLLDTPTIPDKVYKNLPPLLKLSSDVFTLERDKDVFLTALLTILSGMFVNISGIYDRIKVYASLYCFIVAPAASGKGVMSFAKKAGMAYHKKMLEDSKEALIRYEQALDLYAAEKRQKKGVGLSTTPEKPPFKLFFIPANNSAASIIQALSDNNGKGVICESEADTLSGPLTQDWGNFSDILRKNFHHESVTYQRKTSKEYFEIEYPQLSIALSGTPGQVSKLISSVEDGLFSRFIFYGFKVKPEWRDVSPEAGTRELNSFFEPISEKFMQLALFLNSESPVTFTLTPTQWNRLNARFALWLKEVSLFVSEDATSSVKRLGLITFRIAMILSLIRKISQGEVPVELECEDIDFDSSIALAQTYKAHALTMFATLPKEAKIAGLDGNREKLYNALPEKFKREEAITIAKGIDILVERTVDRYLEWLVAKTLLSKGEYGNYIKTV